MNQLENYDNNRDFKGVWIPKIIWIDTRLSGNDKVLLAEIDSLDNSIDHCFASNKYFADFLQVSTRTISRSISKLQELGYINVLGIDNNNNRHIKSNVRLFIDDEGIDKMSRGSRQNVPTVKTNCLHNNINNNTKNKYVVVDEQRFLDAIKIERARILEAYRTDEYSNKAIQYAIDSFNCFGPDQIAFINKFSDSDYNQLFMIAFSLVRDDIETKNVDNKKAFFSHEIKMRINKIKRKEEKQNDRNDK